MYTKLWQYCIIYMIHVLGVDERDNETKREIERERERERLLNIYLITRKNNQSFLVVVGVFLHYSLRGHISFRDKKK